MSLSKSCIDLASYPENWDEISGSVRKRDGYKCCICGGEGVLLHVHHVRPRSEAGSDDPSNLVSVCVTCHAKAHAGWLGESKVDVSRSFEKELTHYLGNLAKKSLYNMRKKSKRWKFF